MNRLMKAVVTAVVALCIASIVRLSSAQFTDFQVGIGIDPTGRT